MEKIEKFILQNREKLDVLSPSKECDHRFEQILNDTIEREIVRVRTELKHYHTPTKKVWQEIENELIGNTNSDSQLNDSIDSSSFDKFDAPANLWSKIENELDKEEEAKENKASTKEVKFSFSKQWISIAAMLIIGVGIGWFGKGSLKAPKETTSFANEWQQAEDYYMTMISNKRMQINSLNFEDVKLLDDFNVQLKQLQKSYTKLKKEEKKSAEPEIIRKQLVINLELQIELLNKQMKIIINANKPKRDHENKKQYSI